VLNEHDATSLVSKKLLPELMRERERLDVIDKWSRWEQDDAQIPRSATPELRSLLQLAKTPWLGLVVTATAQSMFVNGYRSPEQEDDLPPWRLWQENDLDARQVPIHRAMLTYGTSYATVLPGKRFDGSRTAVMRGVSPRQMLAWYENPTEDDWPVYAVQTPVGKGPVRLFDETTVYTFNAAPDGTLTLASRADHGAGVCPVVRYTNMLDLDGRSPGEVEPHISLAKRIDKTTYDRLLAQHFSSWVVRTIAGMAAPDTEEEENRAKLQLRQDDLLIAEDSDTKFGSLPATPLDGFIRAYETDIKTLAAATQTPVYALIGDLINVSADGLAGARASADAKTAERKATAGKAHDQLLKLGSHVAGDSASAADPMAHVTWADTSIRSMSSAADALGKIATMLGVPAKGLWPLIPGVTRTMIEEWDALSKVGGGVDDLLHELGAGNTSPAGQDVKTQADALGVLIRAGVDPQDAARRVGMSDVAFTGAVPVSLRLPTGDAGALEAKNGQTASA